MPSSHPAIICYLAIWTWNYICADRRQPQGKTIHAHSYSTKATKHKHICMYVNKKPLIENKPFCYSSLLTPLPCIHAPFKFVLRTLCTALFHFAAKHFLQSVICCEQRRQQGHVPVSLLIKTGDSKWAINRLGLTHSFTYLMVQSSAPAVGKLKSMPRC